MVNIHIFESTSEAYDESQCSDEIKFGDVLVVESERVVGFLLSAWPIAVTKERGQFHGKATDCTWEKCCTRSSGELERDHPDYNLSYAEAVRVATELGYELDK